MFLVMGFGRLLLLQLLLAAAVFVVAHNATFCPQTGHGECEKSDSSVLSLLQTSRVGPKLHHGAKARHTNITSFEEYIKRYSRSYRPGSAEYALRRKLYEQRVEDVQNHNSNPSRKWHATINHLTDRTEEELKRLRGYRRSGRHGRSHTGMSLLSVEAQTYDVSSLPAEFSWKGTLQFTNEVLDQSECGSCWAFAAAAVLRGHSELFQQDRSFSTEQIVACAPNPSRCGGDGGCNGSTPELAMLYVARAGCATQEELPYVAWGDHMPTICPAGMEVPKTLFTDSPAYWGALSLVDGESSSRLQAGGLAFGMTGYRRLPENQLEPLLFALYREGPVAVTVQSGAEWNLYGGGILDACPQDAVNDHALTLLGWGEQGQDKYWLIQNSWGPNWGEGGFLRLKRRDHSEESKYCGWDRDPKIGSGCDGGPPEVYVCGTCGILYDTVVPTFTMAKGSWWHRNGRRDPAEAQ